MKVSIIIPTYNREAWIGKCLDSIFAQEGVEFIPPFLKEVASPRAGGFMNSDLQTSITAVPCSETQVSTTGVEVIVIDDNSTDRTVEIAKQYPVKLLTSGHRDPEKSKALGLSEATGDLIYFGDSDVVLQTPNWIKEMVKPFQEHPDIFASECNWGTAPDFTSLNAYCALLGIADPLARMLSKRNPRQREHKDTYDLLHFKHGDNPILYCPLWKTEYVRSILSNGLFLEANAPMKLISQGHAKLAHVYTVEAYHYYVTTLSDYLKKRKKIAKSFLTREQQQEMWSHSNGSNSFFSPKFLLSVLYLSSFICPFIESLYHFIKTKRKEWFWHPIASFGTILLYTQSFLRRSSK